MSICCIISKVLEVTRSIFAKIVRPTKMKQQRHLLDKKAASKALEVTDFESVGLSLGTPIPENKTTRNNDI